MIGPTSFSRGDARSSMAISARSVDIDEEPETSKKGPTYGILDIYRWSMRHPWKTATTVICAMMRGGEIPLRGLCSFLTFAVVFGQSENVTMDVILVCAVHCAIGAYIWFFNTMAACFGGWTAECVVNEMQVQALNTQLNQDAAHFDSVETSHARVVTRLTGDAVNAKAALDNRLVLVVNNVVAAFSSVIFILAITWEIGITIFGLCVIILAVFFGHSVVIHRLTNRRTKAVDSAQIALETLEQTRTIQLLTAERVFNEKYTTSLALHRKHTLKIAMPEAINFAIAQCCMFLSEMCCWAVGIQLIFEGRQSPNHVFMANSMASGAGWATVFASPALTNLVRASPAANSLLRLVNGKNLDLDEGIKPEITGDLRVQSVSFSYPTRPNVKAANGLNLKAKPGEAIALVGPSGCGKSTVIQLLERFYAFDKEKIVSSLYPLKKVQTLDGDRLEEISLRHLRNSMALVGQEPVLFRGSVFDNVSLGVEGATLEMVRDACRLANAATFVEAFPGGYETDVGEKGHGLSGGQKQRIAIARALIRNPKILLLDEATSALDTESEKVVEAALRSAASGRTSITIAHRLFTIQRADRIYVIDEGRVIEEGTHEELLELGGRYQKMAASQHLHAD